jgi:murein DD-endopeptidase MepM/ murein hydrolase activator NlpD
VTTEADLAARLAAMQERALAAERDLAAAERQLSQRVYALRQLQSSSQPVRLGAATLALAPTGRPTPGAITSGFGMRLSPIDGELRFHGGIDLGAPFGTAVRATRGGEVILAGNNRGYGQTVIIRHTGGFQTLYGHLSRLEVRPGQQVERGQIIARSGNSGASTGPHLHYEVLYQGRQLDPAPLLNLP